MFKDNTEVVVLEKLRQLYQCCDENLGDVILKRHASIVNFSEQVLL